MMASGQDGPLQAATNWETHTGQEHRLRDLVQNLAKPLHALYQDLHGLKQRITIVVMSEFGRRLMANASFEGHNRALTGFRSHDALL